MRPMKCVSTLGLVAVGVAAACLFASPTGAQDAQATPPAKNLSLDRLAKQVEALQATLNALKAEIEQHAGTPKAAETKGRDLGRHGMMGPADADRGERRGPRGADERGERRPAEQVDRDGEAAADELPRGKEASGRMFDLADRDGDGLLSKEEFSAARRAMSHRMGRRFGRMHRPDRGSQDRMGRKSGRGDMRRLGRGPHGMTHPDDRDGGMRRFGRGPRGMTRPDDRDGGMRRFGRGPHGMTDRGPRGMMGRGRGHGRMERFGPGPMMDREGGGPPWLRMWERG